VLLVERNPREPSIDSGRWQLPIDPCQLQLSDPYVCVCGGVSVLDIANVVCCQVVRLTTRASVDGQTQDSMSCGLFWKPAGVAKHCHAPPSWDTGDDALFNSPVRYCDVGYEVISACVAEDSQRVHCLKSPLAYCSNIRVSEPYRCTNATGTFRIINLVERPSLGCRNSIPTIAFYITDILGIYIARNVLILLSRCTLLIVHEFFFGSDCSRLKQQRHRIIFIVRDQKYSAAGHLRCRLEYCYNANVGSNIESIIHK